MEINQKIDRVLTSEQKIKFQRDNGKFRLLNNIVILPILTAILGIYLESILIVSISIIGIIIFLALKVTSFTRRNVIFDEIIVPNALNELFQTVEYVKKDDDLENYFKESGLVPIYNKFKSHNSYTIYEDKYNINISKVSTKKLHVEENDGVEDKYYEDNFDGIFAYIKLPSKTLANFKAIEKGVIESEEDIVKITNMEFDYCYDVLSKEPVEARGVLSPAVMARIIEFNSKIGLTISFGLKEDMLYLAVNYNEFLDFRGKGKKYVDENNFIDNLKVLEVVQMYVRYFVNMYDEKQSY